MKVALVRRFNSGEQVFSGAGGRVGAAGSQKVADVAQHACTHTCMWRNCVCGSIRRDFPSGILESESGACQQSSRVLTRMRRALIAAGIILYIYVLVLCLVVAPGIEWSAATFGRIRTRF